MPRVFSLKFKLIIYALFLILIAMLTIGMISDKHLHNYFLKDAKKDLYSAFSIASKELKNIEKSLIESIYFISQNQSIIASLNLIKKYENIDNYDSIIFDEEKKRIITILLLNSKASLNNFTAVYNARKQLVAFVNITKLYNTVGYVSYKNSQPVIYAKQSNESKYHIIATPEYININLHIPEYIDFNNIQNLGINYEQHKTQLNLRSSHTILRKYKKSENEIVGYVETNKDISVDALNLLINKQNIQLNYFFNHQPITIKHQEHMHTRDIEMFHNAPLLFSKYNPNELYLDSDTHHFFTGVQLPLEGGSMVLTAHLDKHELEETLYQSRKMLIISLVIIVLISFIISYFVLKRMISIPLKQLLKGIEIITKGDYSYALSTTSNDELGIISKEFNKMAKKISKRETQLDELAHYDTLTNIPNRPMFLSNLQHAIVRAQRNNTKLAIFFLDLDHFKVINDTLGHDIGDELLIKTSQTLSQIMRQNDLLARIGGDEFNILIEDLDSPIVAQGIAQKIIKQMRVPIMIQNHQMQITSSIGIAIYPDDGEDSITLLKNADLAMYNAKEKGRNRYQFFSEELSTNLHNRTSMLHELKEALDKNELELFYQPKFSLTDGSIYAAEALIRWNSSKLGFVTPDQFIPLAEESGEILTIGAWVMEQACRDFATWEKLGLTITQVSVNVSNIQFSKDNFINVVKNSIQKAGISPHSLEIEMTESYIHENSEKALETLHNIRELGVDLALDDFGTGYSSMSYLKRLPLSRLKIDKSFIDDIPHSNDDVEITKIIIALAKVMDLEITAEGIETHEQLHFLQELGCEEGQGYICSKPLPNESFIKLMQSDIKCTSFDN